MKKQNLLTLISITALSMSLTFTPLNTTAKTLESNQDNIILAKSTSEPLIVLKGKSVTCGSKLDRLLALEYLNEDKTRPDFDDISIAVRINGKTAELIQGAQVDLTEHNREIISIDYKYRDKVVKTLKLKVDCGNTGSTFDLIGEAKGGVIILDDSEVLKTMDLLQYVDVNAMGGAENVDIRIMEIFTEESIDDARQTLNNGKKIVGRIPVEIDETSFKNNAEVPIHKIVYSLKNNPNITKELLIMLIENTNEED